MNIKITDMDVVSEWKMTASFYFNFLWTVQQLLSYSEKNL